MDVPDIAAMTSPAPSRRMVEWWGELSIQFEPLVAGVRSMHLRSSVKHLDLSPGDVKLIRKWPTTPLVVRRAYQCEQQLARTLVEQHTLLLDHSSLDDVCGWLDAHSTAGQLAMLALDDAYSSHIVLLDKRLRILVWPSHFDAPTPLLANQQPAAAPPPPPPPPPQK
jgi:hypothetical protein